MKKRVFLAVILPPSLKKELMDLQKELQNKDKNYSWRFLPEETFHLTLIFLGYLTSEEIGKVIKISHDQAKNFSSFSVLLKELDYGPNPLFPRLIWLKGEFNQNLNQLKIALEKEIQKNKINFFPEKRALIPHITLARLKNENSIIPPREKIYQKVDFKIPVESFWLMESILKREGAEYQPIKEFILLKNSI